MKLAVLSDIHGNLPALEAVLAEVRGNVDRTVFLGDLAGYYPFVSECVQAAGPELTTAVLGNHDEVLLRSLEQGIPADYRSRFGSALERARSSLSPAAKELITSWPRQRSLMLDGVKIGMFHGAPWDPLHGRVYPDFKQWQRFSASAEDIILLGHTHYSMMREWKDKIILNPGSVGQPRDASGAACYATLELPARRIQLHRVRYDASQVLADVRRHDPHLPYLAEVLTR